MNIRSVIHVLGAVLVCCGWGGCSHEDSVGDIREIRLSTSLQVSSKAVPDDQIAENQLVGVRIREASANPQYVYQDNLMYAADGLGHITPPSPQYYPQNGNPVIISAYHPYNPDGNPVFDFTIASDQSVDINYYASDLLHHPESSLSRSHTSANLIFSHKLSKITYELIPGVGAPDLSNAVVTLVNIQPSITFNSIDGSLTPITTAPVSVIPNPRFGTIIVPQTIPGNTQAIRVDIDGFSYYYTTPAAGYTFSSGSSYHFFITVNKTGISVTNQISMWNGTSTTFETGSTRIVYAIGDFYPDPTNGATAIGVVFQTFNNGFNGKIVSMARMPCDLNRFVGDGSIYETAAIGLNDLDNGLNNRTIMQNIANWQTEFPAASYWAAQSGGVWYIPSINEMFALCAGYCGLDYGVDIAHWGYGNVMPGYSSAACIDARSAFDAKLSSKGTAFLGMIYLSSSEFNASRVYTFQFSKGESADKLKNSGINAYGTRSIMAF